MNISNFTQDEMVVCVSAINLFSDNQELVSTYTLPLLNAQFCIQCVNRYLNAAPEDSRGILPALSVVRKLTDDGIHVGNKKS